MQQTISAKHASQDISFKDQRVSILVLQDFGLTLSIENANLAMVTVQLVMGLAIMIV